MNHIPTPRKTALDFAVLTAPECPSCPSNTADLPAGSLLPSIPNKPENRHPSDPAENQKKDHPIFQCGTKPEKGWSAGERRSNQNETAGESKTAAGTGAIKKRLTGNSRQPFKLNHFKIVSCLYSMSSSAVLSALYTKMLSILSPFFPVWYLM